MNTKTQYLIGIDEVGRGPIAGPVSVCAVIIPVRRLRRVRARFRALRTDSKGLSPRKRDAWFSAIKAAQAAGELSYIYAWSAHTTIDKEGIVPAISSAIVRALARSGVSPSQAEVLLDGGLRAPAEYVRQKTIIKGDETELPIRLASIAAKVLRDRAMVRHAKRFPAYSFEAHKGYGSRAHYEAIAAHGLCPIHRRSFLRGMDTID